MVTPSGGKLWIVAYRFGGKQKKLSLGAYPKVSLKDARDRRDAAKKQLSNGIDPNVQKRHDELAKANAEANTFSVIAAELIEKKRKEKAAVATLAKVTWLLDIASKEYRHRAISGITPPEVLDALQKVERRGRLETARRLRAVVGEVFRHAIATHRATEDPTYSLRGALAAPTVKPRSALIDPSDFGGLLRAIDGYVGTIEVKSALQLLALTFVRPGELRAPRWDEVDLEAAVWSIPADRMKMRRPHKVPLARQAIAILQDLKARAGSSALLFPTPSSTIRPLSENAFNTALRRMDFTSEQMSAHGFRAVASTLLNESGLWNPDAIERQLAHAEPNQVRRAYARAEFWHERVRMMDWWADKIDQMRSGAKVVAIKAG